MSDAGPQPGGAMNDEAGEHWSEEAKQLFLRYLGRHLVALTGSFVKLGADGNPVGDTLPYNYSGTVVSHAGRWFILTSGHAVELHREAVQRGKARIESHALACCFGVGATPSASMPFDLLRSPVTVVYERASALDYALIPVTDLEREFMTRNGLKPFPLQVGEGQRPSEEHIYRHLLVGFPEERVELERSTVPRPRAVVMQPHCIPVSRQPDDTTPTRPRLEARVVEMGDLKKAEGISGGPLFGFVDRGTSQDCYLLAIQSHFRASTSSVLGCLLDEIFAHWSQGPDGPKVGG
jgi:hypothetical protein